MTEEKFIKDMLPGGTGQYAEFKKQNTYKASLASGDDNLESESPIEGPRPTKKHHFYMPVALRLSSLSAVFLTCIILICLLQYAITTIPHSQSHASLSFLSNVSSQTSGSASQVQKREYSTSVVSSSTIQESVTTHFKEVITLLPEILSIQPVVPMVPEPKCPHCMPIGPSYPQFGNLKRHLQTATTDYSYTSSLGAPTLHPKPVVAGNEFKARSLDICKGPNPPPQCLTLQLELLPSYPDEFFPIWEFLTTETSGADPSSSSAPAVHPTPTVTVNGFKARSDDICKSPNPPPACRPFHRDPRNSYPDGYNAKRQLMAAETNSVDPSPPGAPAVTPTPVLAVNEFKARSFDTTKVHPMPPPWSYRDYLPSYPDGFNPKRQLMAAETNVAIPDSPNKPMVYPTSVEATYRYQNQNPAARTTSVAQTHSLVARQYSKVSYTSTMTSLMSYVTVVPTALVTTDQHAHPTTETTLVSSTVELVEALPTVVTPADEKGTDVSFPRWKVFVGEYLIVLLFVMFRQIWIAIHSQSKLIEPFAHLKSGAAAQEVFDSFYLSSNWIPEPIFAIMRRRWFIFWTSLAYLTVGFLGPLGLQALYLDTNYPNCPYMGNNPVDPCWPPVIAVDPTATRLLQALLAFLAVVILRIMYMVWNMQTGVYSDPSTIAGIASLIHHPAVMEDFSVGPEASLSDIMKTVGQKYYKLDDYQNLDGTWRYGIVPDTSKQIDPHKGSNDSAKFIGFRGWKTIQAIGDILFIFLLIGLLGVIAAYYADVSTDSFNTFMSNATFGPRFMLTTFATIIAMNWKRLEKDVNILSVYHRLAQGSAHARSTILLRKSGHPLSSVFPMLRQKHYFASFMAIVAVLSDPLIIFVGVVPYNPGRTYEETIIAIYACLTILGLMTLTVIAFIIWKGRLPVIPRSPDTLAAVVSYVCDAKMLENFEGCEYVNDNEMNSRVESLGKRYIFNKRAGMDGKIRYLVDEE